MEVGRRVGFVSSVEAHPQGCFGFVDYSRIELHIELAFIGRAESADIISGDPITLANIPR
jgi:hypothetical protein